MHSATVHKLQYNLFYSASDINCHSQRGCLRKTVLEKKKKKKISPPSWTKSKGDAVLPWFDISCFWSQGEFQK